MLKRSGRNVQSEMKSLFHSDTTQHPARSESLPQKRSFQSFIYYFPFSLICSGRPQPLIQHSLPHQILILNRVFNKVASKVYWFHLIGMFFIKNYLARSPSQVFSAILALADYSSEEEMGKEGQSKERTHRRTLNGRNHSKAHVT